MDNIETINLYLKQLKIKSSCTKFTEYKNAYFYDLVLCEGGKIKDIFNNIDELSLLMKFAKPALVKVITNEGIIRLEVIKNNIKSSSLFELGRRVQRPYGELMCLLGEYLNENPFWLDITEAPHILISGTTGSGKSTLLHDIINNLLLYPNVKLFLFDPKHTEFMNYSQRADISFSYYECLKKLEYLYSEMNNRFELLKRGISIMQLPYIVLIIDEFADLSYQDKSKAFKNLICQLAQKCRAARIHIVMATQRPSVSVIDGDIKANFPTRIACKVSSAMDSKIILDTTGAQNLFGKGDCLIKGSNFEMQRFQAALPLKYLPINY